MKTCSKCGLPKGSESFSKDARVKDGLQSQCKVCVAERGRTRRKLDPEKIRGEDRTRYQENPEAYKKRVRAKRQKNLKKAREDDRNRRLRKLEHARGLARARRARNLEVYRTKANFLRRRAYHKNPSFRIRTLLGTRLCELLHNVGAKKTEKTIALLGCSVKEWGRYLESQFRPGMTWGNHGPVWHIDHIKPCAAFNLVDLEQQKLCFNWTNTQPLFVEENLRKSDHYVQPPEQKLDLK